GGVNLGRWVEFADGSGAGAGSANIDAFQMRVQGGQTGVVAPCYKNLHTFDLKVGLKDAASGASGFLTFKGGVESLPSSLVPGHSGTHLDVAFAGPASQSLVLGAHKYEV